MKLNKKGFSYVELVIVMAMLLALVTVVSGGARAAWGARASRAANSFDTLMAQSKVNALSGQKNFIQIVYREKDAAAGYQTDGYYIELYRNGETEPYKSENVANNRIHISFGEEEIGEDKAIRIAFNSSTGAVECAETVAANAELPASVDDLSDPSSVENETKIYFTFGNTSCVTLYKLTGEHMVTH